MKRLILNLLILILFLAGLPIVAENIIWAGEPDETEPENGLVDSQFSYLSCAPNEPGSEGWFIGDEISYVSSEPNEAEDNE